MRPEVDLARTPSDEDCGLALMLSGTATDSSESSPPLTSGDGDTVVAARSREQWPAGGGAITAVKAPGRHALHRDRSPSSRVRVAHTMAWLVPQGLRGRVSLTPGALAVVAVTVALLMGVTAWRIATTRPAQQAMPTITEASPLLAGAEPTSLSSEVDDAPSPGSAAVPAGAAVNDQPRVPGEVVVDVAGRVRRPGIAVLDQGSRVADAIAAAGGARRGVDLTSLNLARVLVDGEQILVGVRASATMPAGASAPGAAPGSSLVSLNQADATQLETLPGVGPVTAAAIIAWRTEHGSFTAIDELVEVDGIGEATLAKLAPLVTL